MIGVDNRGLGSGSGGAGAFGPYDYYVTQKSGNYVAYDSTGTLKITNTTPDIWALLNSIDSGGSANTITKVWIARGNYTGSTTFAPGLNKGYVIGGDYGDMGSVYAQNGTDLAYSGTSKAIDCSVNWVTPMTTNTAQVLELQNLIMECPNSTGDWINLTAAARSRIQNCKFQTNSTAAVSGSVVLHYPSVSNVAPHYLMDNVFANAGATQIIVNSDFVWIYGVDIAVCNTGARACIDYEAGETHKLIGFNSGYNGLSPSFSLNPIYDNRPAAAMEDGALKILTMMHITGETTTAIYQNVNDAYFVMVGMEYTGGTPYLDYATNIPTSAFAKLAANVTNATSTDHSCGTGVTLFANFAKSVIGNSGTQWTGSYNSAFRIRGAVQVSNGTAADGAVVKVYRSTTGIPASGSGINAGDTAVWSYTLTEPVGGGATVYSGAFDFTDTGLSIATQYWYYLTIADVTGGTATIIGNSTAPNATAIYAEAI